MCVTGIHVSCFLHLLLVLLLLMLSAVHLIHLRVGHTYCAAHGDPVRK